MSLKSKKQPAGRFLQCTEDKKTILKDTLCFVE
jgi:hypothetical protein